MRKLIYALFFISFSTMGLVACTSTQVGTATGAAAGAGIGYAVGGGSAAGTIIGAGAGALVGNAIGQEQDRRNSWYWHRYHH